MLKKEAPNVRTIHEEVVDRMVGVKTQLFFCGGHGGSVGYDGDGGPMDKKGGPIDRVYVLRSEGELGGNHGLDITYGSIDFKTGPLAKDIDVSINEAGDTVQLYTFEENSDENAVVITGGVSELDIPNDTVLFHGSVRASEMQWILGDKTGDDPTLPYTAIHTKFEAHPELLKRFEIGDAAPGVAVSAWCKVAFSPNIVEGGPKGFPFRTQQHLGSLRVAFDNPS